MPDSPSRVFPYAAPTEPRMRWAWLKFCHRQICRASHWTIDTERRVAICNVCGFTYPTLPPSWWEIYFKGWMLYG